MSSSSAGSLDNASKEPLDPPLGSLDGKSRTGTKDGYGSFGLSDSKSNGPQLSTTAPDHSDGAEVVSKPSTATRLGASASGLMSAVLASSSANGLPPEVLAGATDGSKRQSSSGTYGPSESSTAVQNFKNQPDAGVGSSRAPIQPESFRSSPTAMWKVEKGAQYDFDEFMFNRDGPMIVDHGRPETYNGQWNSNTKHDQIPRSTSNTLTRDNQIPTMGLRSATFAYHEGDGAAVVSLLSDPEFSVDDHLAYHDMYAHDVAAQDPLISRLTSQELDILNKIKAQLPPPPIHRGPAPTNPLNLLPDFDHLSGDTDGRFASNFATTKHAEKSHMYLSPDATMTWSHGEASSGQSSGAPEAHLSQWLDVLNRYQDEVWGDMLPLVQDARKEIEQAKNSNAEDAHEGPAIRRLAMIFAHLKASPASEKARLMSWRSGEL